MRLYEIIDYEDEHEYKHGTDRETRMALYGIVRMQAPSHIIEVGVSEGSMTLWLAAALADGGGGHLTSVDNWSTNHGGGASGPGPALSKIQDFGLEDTVTFVSQDSVAFLSGQKTNSAELVWIDGDHSYQGCKRDVSAGWRVTSNLLAVHDTEHTLCDHVRSAIRDLRLEGCWLTGRRGIWIGHKEMERK